MTEKLLPLKLPPGMRNTGTVYQSKGRWYSGNFVRFFQDTIQPIGGWSQVTTSGATMAGVPTAALCWVPDKVGTAQVAVTAIGTTRGLYILSGTVLYDITPADITTDIANRIWTLDTFGAYLIAASTVKGAYASSTGPYVWQCDTSAVAAVMSGAMIRPQAVVSTPERFVFQLGGVSATPEFTGVPSTRTVYWPSQETIDDWTPSAINTAGEFNLSTDGALVAGAKIRGATMLWTTTDVWTATYIGGEFVYRFDKAGTNCGLIAPNAKAVIDTAAYWMGQQQFFVYDGFVRPLPCDVQDYVFGSFNRAYAHLVWCYPNPVFGEITWHYPDAAATTCTRYVTHNYRENHWVYGTLTRHAGITAIPPAVNPVLLNASGAIFTHETGTSRNGEGTPSLESGPLEIEDGDHLVQIQSVLPDDKTVGDVNLTIYTAPNPDTAETSNGPYTLTARTTLRVKARQVRLKLTEAVAAAWRVGVIRLGVIKSSKR
jgi:hypothetical protein